MIPKKTLIRSEEIRPVLQLGSRRQLELSRPLVMGILNVTPDSFSDGNTYGSTDEAVERAHQMIDEGADIIDIGGESSRPGADPVSAEEEMKRVLPVIEGIRKVSDAPISIDTYKSISAEAALDRGADLVNDISALRFDSQMAGLVASRNVPVILMHMLGTPRDMQRNPHYGDCVHEIEEFFQERISYCVSAGIDKSKIILDPGIGFGKRLSDNVEILSHLTEFKRFGLPVLVGTSRKSFINMLHPSDLPPQSRIGGSIASMVTAVLNGANIVRVHDVAETVEALKVVSAVKGCS